MRGPACERQPMSTSQSAKAVPLHRPTMDLLPSAIVTWPPLARIATTVLAGLGGAALMCWVARRALGRDRARFSLGAS